MNIKRPRASHMAPAEFSPSRRTVIGLVLAICTPVADARTEADDDIVIVDGWVVKRSEISHTAMSPTHAD